MQGISCFHCERCGKETHFIPIYHAVSITGMSRSTIRYWIRNQWVHWLQLPSRKRLICLESLHLRQAKSSDQAEPSAVSASASPNGASQNREKARSKTTAA